MRHSTPTPHQEKKFHLPPTKYCLISVGSRNCVGLSESIFLDNCLNTAGIGLRSLSLLGEAVEDSLRICSASARRHVGASARRKTHDGCVQATYPLLTTFLAIPYLLIWKLVDAQRWLEAHEMEGSRTSVTAQESADPSARGAKVLVGLRSDPSAMGPPTIGKELQSRSPLLVHPLSASSCPGSDPA